MCNAKFSGEITPRMSQAQKLCLFLPDFSEQYSNLLIPVHQTAVQFVILNRQSLLPFAGKIGSQGLAVLKSDWFKTLIVILNRDHSS